MIAGALSPAAWTRATMSASVPLTVACSGVVPQRTSATGVSGARPRETSSETMVGRFFTPMKKTRVPMPVASADQSMPELSLPGSSWPVTKAIVEVSRRWVSGMPA